MKFKELAIGQEFRFSSERDFPYSGMATGPWVKISARGYRHVPDNGYSYKVGSVNTEVIPPVDRPKTNRPRLDVAKKTFAHLMQESRVRSLGPAEKRTLTRARQTLRQARKPAMNAVHKKFIGNVMSDKPLGGVKTHRSKPFNTREKAMNWIAVSVDILEQTGKKVERYWITEVIPKQTNAKRKRRVNPETCPICGRSAGSPYRVYDDRGKVISGCVSDFHTGHLVTPSESARFHSRKEAVSIRRKLAKGQAGKGYSNPPKPTEIYRDITRVEGTKGEDSQYPGEKFFHNFKLPYPKMIGLKNGSLLIRSKR
jgi:hypothetical protein